MTSDVFQNPPTLENNQIQLIPLEIAHANALSEITDARIWEFMLTKANSKTNMDNWIRVAISQRESKNALPFAVVLKETGKIIGSTRLFDIDFNQKSGEIGHTWYGVDYWRSFVNSTCKKLLLKYCFEELKFVRVQFTTDVKNERSQNAISRLGASYEGKKRNSRILADGSPGDAMVYSITNDDWPEIQKKFIEREIAYQKNETQKSL